MPPRLVIPSLFVVAVLSGVACRATVDDRPRPELEGDVDEPSVSPVTGVGGAVGMGGAGGAFTATSTSDGVTVGVGVGGAGGAGGAPLCSDLDEPNDSEATALYLGAINDCDSNEKTLVGALNGSDDADWYRFDGSDDFGCVVDPTRGLAADGPIRLCKFAECEGVVVSCQDGSLSASSPKGNPGCCHSQGFTMDVDCDGTSDDATVHFRLDQAGAACVEYTLAYHY